MPLDRLSALRRALVPRIGLGLTFTSRTVHSLQHLTSPDSLDIRRRQNPLMPAVPALTVTHPSAPRPAAANLSHDVVLSESDRADRKGRTPDDVPRHDIVTPSGDEGEKGKAQKKPGTDVARPHDRSTLDNDSPDHPGRASPHSLPSPHPDSSEIREALLGHLGVRARAEPSPQISEASVKTRQGGGGESGVSYHLQFSLYADRERNTHNTLGLEISINKL